MSLKLRIFLAIAASMTIFDQLTKVLVRRSIPLKDRVEVIPNLLDFWHRSNEGAAFGIFRNFEYRIAVFTLVALFAFGFIGYTLRGLPPRDRWLPASLGFITSGALGNLIDRLVFREVTDFIDVHVGWKGGLQSWLVEHLGTYHYNTFNIADAGIVIGVAMFLIHAIFMQPKAAKQSGKAKE